MFSVRNLLTLTGFGIVFVTSAMAQQNTMMIPKGSTCPPNEVCGEYEFPIAVTALPPSVPVLADANQVFWILWTDMKWEIGNSGVFIVVLAGFVTDFASIPQGLWTFGLTPTGSYGRAAIIHDYLYWT
jgi:hypothetical protein